MATTQVQNKSVQQISASISSDDHYSKITLNLPITQTRGELELGVGTRLEFQLAYLSVSCVYCNVMMNMFLFSLGMMGNFCFLQVPRFVAGTSIVLKMNVICPLFA